MNRLLSIGRRIRSFVELGNPSHSELSLTTHEVSDCLRCLVDCNSLSSAIFRKQVILRLRDILERLRRLVEGRLIFESTETWRTVYEDVLQTCETRRYLSVALIRSDDYWRDSPGENSLEFNFALLAHGFYVHRVFLIDGRSNGDTHNGCPRLRSDGCPRLRERKVPISSSANTSSKATLNWRTMNSKHRWQFIRCF